MERVEITGADECCGFGGLFSVEMPEVSAAILRAKLDAIEASGAEVLAGGDVSCLLHIGGGLRKRGGAVRVCHLAELLAREGGRMVSEPRSGVAQAVPTAPVDAKTMPVTFLGRAKLDLGSDKVAAVEDGARRLYRHRAEAVAGYPAMEEMRPGSGQAG